MVSTFEITSNLKVGTEEPLLLIAGPCVIEERDFTIKWAEKLKEVLKPYPFQFVFKASYDKANRTSGLSPRGPGLEQGLSILSEVKSKVGVPVLTDVHESTECALVAEVVDILQIPAFLCRQTTLLQSAGKTNKTVNIKKGQFLHPDDIKYAAEKVKQTGNPKILITERGTCFGYRDLVVDMRSLSRIRQQGFPVIFDGTHSVQQLGGGVGKSIGNRFEVLGLVRAAVAVGIDGVFLEVHPNPDFAPSDGPNMLTLELFRTLLEQIYRLNETVKELRLKTDE
ncbi:MAG: 3-deoxy-8-phosphooctulonate synthase [bacterium]|nr:3-deoxy-8-phosphooctulonate synthase [bacterium]